MSFLLAVTLAAALDVHSFDAPDVGRWSCVNDSVMGGRSTSRIEATEDGTVRFLGNLSLENNGGFTSFRTRNVRYDLAGSDGIEVLVRGDGRTYIMSFEVDGVWLPAGGYWQSFETIADEWTTVRLPYDGFTPTSFGQEVRAPALDPAGIASMAIYLYDKQPGPFALEVDEIASYRGDARGYVTTPAQGTSSRSHQGGAGTSAGTASNADGALLPDECSVLATLLQRTGLDEAVAGLDGFTLFAPTDDAFAALPDDVVASLLRPENEDALKSVLLHHVIDAPVTAFFALQTDEARMLDGQVLPIRQSDAGLSIGAATVVSPDRVRGGGVVHVIDAVLVPADLQLVTSTTGKALALLMDAVDRGAPLFNDGNPEACAAVYRTSVEAVLAFASDDLGPELSNEFARALDAAEGQTATEAAWTLRFAMDLLIAES